MLFRELTLSHKPVLFFKLLGYVERLPPGWSLYELQGSYATPKEPVSMDGAVAAYYAGTIIAPAPIGDREKAVRQIRRQLRSSGTSITFEEFCQRHNLTSFPTKQRFSLSAASPDELERVLPDSLAQESASGMIGDLNIDFGKRNESFLPAWTAGGNDSLDTPAFREELNALIEDLRMRGPLSNPHIINRYCSKYQDPATADAWRKVGYTIETDNYRYCLRYSYEQGHSHVHITAFNLQEQRLSDMNAAPEAEIGMTM